MLNVRGAFLNLVVLLCLGCLNALVHVGTYLPPNGAVVGQEKSHLEQQQSGHFQLYSCSASFR